jgi:hypothetical protein
MTTYTFRAIEGERFMGQIVRWKEENRVDTMTYASVAVLPWSIAQDRTHHVLPEVEFIRLDVSVIKR